MGGERLAPLVPSRDWDPDFAARSAVFSPLAAAAAGLRACADFPPVAAYGRLLSFAGHRSAGGAPLRFVEQDAPGKSRAPTRVDELYDGRIHQRGEIPTRARSWHDLFNALVWASFPRAKTALNARQYRALVARLPERFDRLPGARTREQDALAMLDEGGVLLLVGELSRRAASEAHAAGDVEALQALVRDGEVTARVFGHALHEHAVSSPSPVRGRGVILRVEHPRSPIDVDESLAALLSSGEFPEKSSAPAVPLSLAAIAETPRKDGPVPDSSPETAAPGVDPI